MSSTQAYLFHRKDLYTCFPPKMLGVAVVNNLETLAISLAKPRPSLPECFPDSPFLDLPLSQLCLSVNRPPSLWETSHVHYSLVTLALTQRLLEILVP